MGNGVMVALYIDTTDRVNAFHAKALELGGINEGNPGFRPEENNSGFYAGYFRDLDGNKIMDLEKADISKLEASGWKPPIPVKVKARDGETDIYGLMYTPTNLDESKSYPIVNYLYPGPQSGFSKWI